MGFKYQVISCMRPEEIVGMTLEHLQALRNVIQSQPQVVELVDDAVARVHSTFDDMGESEYILLRRTLANFLQDRKVKVSIFLQENIQSTDGSIVVNPGGRVGFGVNPPGQVRYFAGGQHYRTEHLAVLDPATVAMPWSPATTEDRCGQTGYLGLGLNMYDRTGQGATGKPATLPQAVQVDPAVARAAAVGELNA